MPDRMRHNTYLERNPNPKSVISHKRYLGVDILDIQLYYDWILAEYI